MGNPSRTTFSIPAHHLGPQQLRVLNALVSQMAGSIEGILSQPPAADPEAGGDHVSMRLVHGTSCLVLERDEWPDGGIATEEQLIAAKIPFIRTNDVTRDYMASKTVSDGTTTIETRFDHGGCPIVGVSIRDGHVIIDAEELEDLQCSIELQRQILAVPAAVAATG